jgi:hypothetical protein
VATISGTAEKQFTYPPLIVSDNSMAISGAAFKLGGELSEEKDGAPVIAEIKIG